MDTKHTDPLQLLTPEHTAGLLAVSIDTLLHWRMHTTGQPVPLPWVKIGHYVRYPVRGLVQFLRTHTYTTGARPGPDLWPEGCAVTVAPAAVPARCRAMLAMVTAEDIAARFGVTPETLRTWPLPLTMVGHFRRYPLAALAEVIRTHTFTAGGKPCPEAWGKTSPATIAAGPFLTAADAGKAIGLNPTCLMLWRLGKGHAVPLPFVMIVRGIRYPEPLLRAWVEANTRQSVAGRPRKPTTGRG